MHQNPLHWAFYKQQITGKQTSNTHYHHHHHQQAFSQAQNSWSAIRALEQPDAERFWSGIRAVGSSSTYEPSSRLRIRQTINMMSMTISVSTNRPPTAVAVTDTNQYYLDLRLVPDCTCDRTLLAEYNITEQKNIHFSGI